MNPEIQRLDLSNDILFSVLMQQERFCQAVLRILLNREVVAIEYHQVEKSFQNLPGYRSVRLDAYVRDEKGEIFNIEMQTVRKGDLVKRARYYQGMLDVSGLLSGKGGDYRRLPRTYVIFIARFDLFGEGRYQYTFQNRCDETDKPLGDESVKMFLNTRGTREEGVDPTLIRFLRYVENSTAEEAGMDPSVKEIHRIAMQLKRDQEVETRYMRMDWVWEEGIEEGIERGEKIGKEIGLWEQRVIIIQRLNSGGMSAGQIAGVLGMEDCAVEAVLDQIRRNPGQSPEQTARMLVEEIKISRPGES